MLNFSAQWNFEKAAENAKCLVESSWKLSPALFAYCYAAFTSMLVDERPELRAEVTHYLLEVPKLKRNFGGKKAFHEKLVIDRSRKYADNEQSLVFAPLDLMYMWNVFVIAACQPDCLPRILGHIDAKLEAYPKTGTTGTQFDTYCYLTFMRGVCYRHSGCPLLAMECFYEVLAW